MAIPSTLSYEWYIPDRVYIIHLGGLLTLEMLAEASHHVLDQLNTPGRTQPVHLIYNAGSVHLEADLDLIDIQDWSALVYRHPLTASIVTVTGLNRLHTHIVTSMNTIFSSTSRWGQVAQTLNEGLRMVTALDLSLPRMNV